MKNALIQLQIFNEIAMSIGNSLNLDKMLQESLSAYLRKLNCSAGLIMMYEKKANGCVKVNPIYSIPRKLERNPAYPECQRIAPESLNQKDLNTFNDKLPIKEDIGGGKIIHFLELPEFGFLTLVKNKTDLDPIVIKSLKTLNEKLARACVSCIQNQEIQKINKQLKKEMAEHKKTEEALRISKQRYQTLLGAMPDPVIIYDEKGNTTYINEAFTKTYGWTREEVLGHPIDFVPPEELEASLDVWKRAFKGERILFKTKRYTKDGRLLDIQLRTAVLNIPDGQNNTSIVLHRDISELKKMEEELLKIKKLETVGILSGGIAHDFNNLLSIVMGNISMASEYLDPHSPAYEFLDEAEKASIRARDVTKQLMIFSKGGTPILETDSISSHIHKWIDSISVNPNIKIKLSFEENLWPISFDKKQMEQVFRNLITNSMEAMPGGGSISIIVNKVTINGEIDSTILPIRSDDYILITFKDTGKGISEKYLSSIFDPYFTTKEMGTQKGLGLGLATSYSIIKKHNGYIHVESEKGIGSIFYIYLPASKERITKKKKKSIGKASNKLKILIMDDEGMLRKILVSMLVRLGYDVQFSSEGSEAVALYDEAIKAGFPFDAVILNMTVDNGMGGREAFRKLIKIDPDVKAIISSGYTEHPAVASFEEYGFKAAIHKPYQIKDLKKVLDRVLN